ncbi:hypothetical protein BDP27DRAFT_1419680 [Rhodocollybia butyracea]|uniref:Uncharacterized protein n=1 Tax=Rhodocollybia butyracea TaxID=206335 RepID=A0A9P5PR48_9AGAR|nr:hypothetical protein BDP27DRAFT_1419680 [Rhodocollybia butyracea]
MPPNTCAQQQAMRSNTKATADLGNVKNSVKTIAEEDHEEELSASRAPPTLSPSILLPGHAIGPDNHPARNPPRTPLPSVQHDPPITLPTNWEEEDDGLSTAILAGEYNSIRDYYDRYVASFSNRSFTIFKILKMFDLEIHSLAHTHPNPPAIDDSLPLGNAAMEAAMEVDEQGVLAALIHTTYLLWVLAMGLLPETCVWYTECFGKEEIPFDDWVNHYRIEQDEKAASVHQDVPSKFASDGLGKPDEEEGDEGSAKVVQDKRSETLEKSDKEVNDDSTDVPSPTKVVQRSKASHQSSAHSLFNGDKERLVDYPSSPALFATEGCVSTEGPALPTLREARMAKLRALATLSTWTQLPGRAQVEEHPPACMPPQSTYSHHGHRLFKKAVVDPEASEDSHDSHDDHDYRNRDEESNDDEAASASVDDEEELQSGRRKPRQRTKGKVLRTGHVKAREPRDVEVNAAPGGRGALPQDAKDRLDALMAKQDEEIEAIAHEYGKPVELCYKYVDGGDSRSTRAVTYWNIWQQWYSIHGERKKPVEMPVSEWTGVVHKELDTFLHGKLDNEDFDSPEAWEEALEEQINWYWEHHNALIGDMIAKGRGSTIATKILRPIVQMANRAYRETGYHIGGYAWHPNTEPSIFVGTKATNGMQMFSQAQDIALHNWLSVRNPGIAYAIPHAPSPMIRASHHIIYLLPRTLFDGPLDCIFDKGDVPKLNFANFVASAWKHQVRVKNWPVGVPFFQVGVKTKKGFVTGVAALNRYKASDLNKICGPRMEQIRQAVDGEEGNDNLQYFEVERWTDEERTRLRLQWSTIPVVSDTENKTIVSVAHSELYRMVHGDTGKEEENGASPGHVSPTLSLFANDSDDDDHCDRIDSRPARTSTGPGQSVLAQPLKSRHGRLAII